MSTDTRLDSVDLPGEETRRYDRLLHLPGGVRVELRGMLQRAEERRRVADLVAVLSFVTRADGNLRPARGVERV